MPVLELLITRNGGGLCVFIRQRGKLSISIPLPFRAQETVRGGWFGADTHQDPASWVMCPKLEKVRR